ncbi:MAG: hypothetical protein U0638_13755 [Phycisphaerales bacterium]
MPIQTAFFKARVDRVIDHAVLDVMVDLAFGISLQRRVRVIDAPSVTPGMVAAAKAALVTLCGGKKVVLCAAPDQYAAIIDARVGYPYPEPPAALSLPGYHCGLLDVGLGMKQLESSKFSKSAAVELARGRATESEEA